MIADVVYNGWELKFRGGNSASVVRNRLLAINNMSEGYYTICLSPDESYSSAWLRLATSRPSNHGEVSHSPLMERRTRVTNLLPIVPYTATNISRFMPTHLHDHLGRGRTAGIEIPAYFFSNLDGYAKRTGKTDLILHVDYVNRAPWVKTAWGELGTDEQTIGTPPKIDAQGNVTSPSIKQILLYWDDINRGGINKVSTPWCAGFVGWCLKQNNLYDTAPDISEGSLNWATYGTAVTNPTYGTIAIKSRGGGKGHIAFLIGQNADGTKTYALGGNQADQVCVMEFPKSDWIHYRQPIGYNSSRDILPVYTGSYLPSGRLS